VLAVRRSPETTANQQLVAAPAQRRGRNRAWIARGAAPGDVALLGGSSLEHFRIRVAQSRARGDLLPSFWSLAGIVRDAETFFSVPLEFDEREAAVAANNGVRECAWKDYDDPRQFPNLALLRFAADGAPILANVERIRRQRSVIDLPALMVSWLGYVWGTAQSGNPLLEGNGLPSAVFVQTVYGIAGIELAPGLASAGACPEVIWQAAKWWQQFYAASAGPGDATHAATASPSGTYVIRQPAAAVVEEAAPAAHGDGGVSPRRVRRSAAG
jgi:hypothetical protein